jgi:polysaccharide pyruvyl transferase WcaK-like protein
VPLNGGDEALLRAALGEIHRRWGEASVTVLCKDPALSQSSLQDVHFEPDLEFASPPVNYTTKILNAFNRRCQRWGILGLRVSESREYRRILGLYRKSDAVFSSAGGFLHDFYDIKERLRGFEHAIALAKPTFILPQSIGPFWKPESIAYVRKVLPNLNGIFLRDSISGKHLEQCGVNGQNVHNTADLAFLLLRQVPELWRAHAPGVLNKIGMCFREWPISGTQNLSPLVDKAAQLCRLILSSKNVSIKFISTCQGVAQYVDDSHLALRIVQRLPPVLRVRCEIDKRHRHPRDLIQSLGELDAFVGMRLHGCLLAMLGGTPAMGLGYETKTEQIFGSLGFGEYQARFDDEYSTWQQCWQRFCRDGNSIHGRLHAALEKQCKRAESSFDIIEEVLSKQAESLIS